jgi:hypothetical protein
MKRRQLTIELVNLHISYLKLLAARPWLQSCLTNLHNSGLPSRLSSNSDISVSNNLHEQFMSMFLSSSLLAAT